MMKKKGHLGRFWRGLGASWGGLWRSWVRLARLLGHLRSPWVDFCRFKPNKAERGVGTWPIWVPKWDQKGTQNTQKSKIKTMTKKDKF